MVNAEEVPGGDTSGGGDVGGGTFPYCILGAGPGGMQLGHFMQEAGMDYVILERNLEAGSFFRKFPRHRTLISINKKWTGSNNPDFNLRHDWNSLLHANKSFRFTSYTDAYYPTADEYLVYLRDYARVSQLNIHYGTTVTRVSRDADTGVFHVTTDDPQRTYECLVFISAAGIDQPHYIGWENEDDIVESYASHSLDPNDYKNKTVLILGRGNSAAEVALHLSPYTAFIHMVGHSAVRLSFLTHYVGDIRATNDAILDQYQLKSLDGLLEVPDLEALEPKRLEDGRIYMGHTGGYGEPDPHDAFRHPYDKVIRCIGWEMDTSIYDDDVYPHMLGPSNKYPVQTIDYESENVPGLFFAGALQHYHDVRKSSGGFIHGFRYLTESLFHILRERFHGDPWPHETIEVQNAVGWFIERLKGVSSSYQMFYMIGDVMVFHHSDFDLSATVYRDVPLARVAHMAEHDPVWGKPFLVVQMSLEYGIGFHGEAVLQLERAISDVQDAEFSNFLHPIFRMLNPDYPDDVISTHHMLEDFLTDWSTSTHIEPLAAWLEDALKKGLTSALRVQEQQANAEAAATEGKPQQQQEEGSNLDQADDIQG